MALAYLLDPSFQTLDENGRPLVGGYIEVYYHNTSVKYVTKADFEGTNNPFKVPLNSKGMAVIIASDSNAYDVFCYDAFGTLFWSRQNVSTIGGSGGGGGGGMQPSILVAQSDTMEGDDDTESQDFTFSQIEKVGDDIYIDDNNEIRLKKGIYHVSLVITFNVNSTEESRPWIEEVTFNYPLGYSGTLLDRSIRWPHGGSSNISVDFDYVVNSDDTKLAMWLNSLGDEAYAKMKPISIHKIAEVE